MRGFFLVLFALSLGTGCGSPKAAVPELVAPAPVTSLATHAWGEPRAVPRESPPTAIQRSTLTCVVAERDVRSFGRSRRAIEIVRQEAASLGRNLSQASASNESASVALALGDAETELAELDPSGADELLASAKRHYQLSAAGPGADAAEAKYRLGMLAECDHDLQTARKLYFQVVSEAPRSPLLAHAYFAFGELFAEESKQDSSKTELARQAYAECTKLGRGVIENLARERLRTLANPP